MYVFVDLILKKNHIILLPCLFWMVGKVKSRVKSKVICSKHDVPWFSTFHRDAACGGGRVTPHLTVDRAMLQRDRVVCEGSQAAHSPCHSRVVTIQRLHQHLQTGTSPLTTLLLSLLLSLLLRSLSFGTLLYVFLARLYLSNLN